MQEIANDSTTLISRALGKAANVLEVLSETTHLLLYRIRFCAKIPGDSARAQDAYFGERDQRFRLNVIGGSD